MDFSEYNNFIGVTAHFVDNEFNLKSAILDCCTSVQHAASNLTSTLKKIMNDWKINEKTFNTQTFFDRKSIIFYLLVVSNWIFEIYKNNNILIRNSVKIKKNKIYMNYEYELYMKRKKSNEITKNISFTFLECLHDWNNERAIKKQPSNWKPFVDTEGRISLWMLYWIFWRKVNFVQTWSFNFWLSFFIESGYLVYFCC